jgi:hypothetical protein
MEEALEEILIEIFKNLDLSSLEIGKQVCRR